MDTWKKFYQSVEKYGLVEPGDKLIVAVSGGPDSVSLLHLLWRLQKTVPIELFVVCFDHGLRKQSEKEALFVRNLSQRHKISCEIKHINVKKHARAAKISMETAGRHLRYASLFQTAVSRGFNKIATGHTANDNAETLLMWLLRGTGLDGLAGIPLHRRLGNEVSIIRPILSLTKKEILAYLRAQGVSYCIDQTNYQLEYTRNKIRRRVVPLLERINPEFITHAYNLSRIIAQENEYLNTLMTRAFQRVVTKEKNKITLDLKLFFGYNKTIQARVLKAVFPEKHSQAHIERFLEWVGLSKSKRYEFSRTWKVEKSTQCIVFKKV